MLVAWAVGAYGAVAGNEMMSKKVLRQMAAVAMGVSVFAAGYVSAAMITDMATRHYESVLNGQTQPTVFSAALAEEAERADVQQTEAQNEEAKEMRGRGAGDLSFTGRTIIWNNVIEIWKSRPKYFVRRWAFWLASGSVGNGIDDAQRVFGIYFKLWHHWFYFALLFFRFDYSADVPRVFRIE